MTDSPETGSKAHSRKVRPIRKAHPRKERERSAEEPSAGYLKTGQLARICAVDSKTVWNWVQEKKFPASAWMKTPGGQLRFRRGATVTWLVQQGFDVPAELQGLPS